MCCCYHSLVEAVSTLRLYFPVLRHYLEISSRTSIFHNYNFKRGGWGVGGLATTFDLAAFRLSMIALVKKSVNHPRNVASMRETGNRNNNMNSVLVLLVIAFFGLLYPIYFRGNKELMFSFLLVLRLSLQAVYYAKNETSENVPRCPTFWLCVSI